MLLLALEAAEPDEREFLTGLYQEYHRLMFSVAGKYTSNPQDKEDIVQEALVKLVRNVRRLRERERCTLVSFVVILVRNTAVNYLRHQNVVQKHTQAWPESGDDFIPDSLPMPDELVLLRERVSLLARIWPQLSEGEQLLLGGKYLMELSDAELAQLVGCKPDSIRMKLTRARRHALQKMLKEEDCCDKPGQIAGQL